MSVARQYRAKLAGRLAGSGAGQRARRMAAAGRRVSRAAAGRRVSRAAAGRRVSRAAAAVLASCTLLASCAVGSDQPVFKRVGPVITLRVGVFGDPGYQRAGLYRQYERLHPNIKIIQSASTDPASYWYTLQARLKSGQAVDDIQAVPMADISAVTGTLASDFVPLNTLGGISGGNSAFTDDWLPWVAQQAANRAGITYALGAEIGPIAACYRTSLLREAGLPTSPTVLARDWSSWAGYLKFGRLFHQRIPHGPAFTDSADSLYNTMAAQAKEQYYSQAGQLAVAGNPAIKQAWNTAVRAARDGLSAGLTPQSAAWDRGVTRGSFATVMCPAWLLHRISSLAGPLGSGGWNVTTAPGGAGNSGGFYLALPKAGAHQQAAFQLATFLAGEQAGVELFRSQGEFPANFAAVTAVNGVTNPYFSDAQVGHIFGRSADRTPAAVLGPASDAIGADIDSALARVESGQATPGPAWRAAVQQAAAAARAGPQ
jgi:cellobiose transport system substrate-binding protein